MSTGGRGSTGVLLMGRVDRAGARATEKCMCCFRVCFEQQCVDVFDFGVLLCSPILGTVFKIVGCLVNLLPSDHGETLSHLKCPVPNYFPFAFLPPVFLHLHYYSIAATCSKIATCHCGGPCGLIVIYLGTWLPLHTS
jgi:hypothetical protein